ncbi:General transcription and DNA repair factor IIH helicase subunit XPB [Astathelohania contejeani]|uniref:DNA 3'-5' helicase n=1 Tax=Astathelohania contejeani TaxID=164912 RepID=A0ABQ7HXE6_9MICR|nr:General transcription and DNA repair factor IIH helicase subunit XPB [Thelohania contejeani]
MSESFLPKKATKHEFAFESIKMKPEHTDCPFWVNYDALIILEVSSPLFRAASSFLIAISEPVSRPSRMHEYRITAYSLYAAVSVGLTTDDILHTLDRFSKNYLPTTVIKFVRECTISYGKIKLIMRQNRYFIEAVDKEILKLMQNDPIIGSCINRECINEKSINTENECIKINENCFEVLPVDIEKVKKRCIDIDYPLIEEYDFRNAGGVDIKIDLRSTVSIRSYQEICLNKMFGNGRARSGIIVLPCGSGKTLVGITAISTIKKSALVLCTSTVSVEQWRQQILSFTNISNELVARFTSDHKERLGPQGGILITTYTMLAYTGKRSSEAQRIMDNIKETEWGLLLLDEVHVVPAMMFRKVISLVSHHCKLGLTATLVREDDKIEDLNFLIGPKLYEADWQDLSAQGHIATVDCTEVWCAMTAEFYREYLLQNNRRRRVISIMNPTKMQICEYLINRHEKRGDKIIVFSDNVCALKTYALKLKKPFIYGPTGQAERMRILKQFQTNPLINTIFLSKVGDTSIDLPEATCLIQISSHYGSRRQEAQRLGRILRAKKRNDPGFKVFFYSLVSKDTDEMFYSSKRQQFLVDQGYTFKVVTHLKGVEENPNRICKSKTEQKELLASILLANEVDLESEESESQDNILVKHGNIKAMSGGEGMAYIERNTARHILFRKRDVKTKKEKK